MHTRTLGRRSRDAQRVIGGLSLAAAAAAATLTPLSAHADKSLAAQLKQLQQRMQQLEQRNQALEQQVQALRSAKPDAAPTPAGNAAAASSASTSTSASDADDAAAAQAGKPDRDAPPPQGTASSPPAAAPAAEGPGVETKLTAVAQHVNNAGAAAGQRQRRLSYRGDVVVKLPAGEIGAARGMAVGHLRFGKGNGVAMRPTYTGAVNSTAFEASAGSAQTYAIVAEAYYQLERALGSDRLNGDKGDKSDKGDKGDKGDRLELTIGKIDLFGFFD